VNDLLHDLTQTGYPHSGPTSLRLAGVRAAPSRLALFRPVYWIACGLAAGVALRFGGIEAATITMAALIAIWAFVEPRAVLWLSTAFMVYLFVFFQREAPLGDELPEEFLFWGTGLALITAGLVAATIFSSQVDWAVARKRFLAPVSLAMTTLLAAILAASVYGLFVGNEPFAVVRQFFGCVLLPVYYFLALVLLRSAADAGFWLRRVSWCVALGSAWYAVKLSSASAAFGYYYREQSPLSAYAGAVGVVAWAALIEERRPWPWFQALAQGTACLLAIFWMGNRAALASLLAAVGVLSVVAFRRRGIAAMAGAALLVSGAFAGVAYFGNQMIERRGLTGEIARRFVITPSEDSSFQGRMAQMDFVVREFKRNPVLGAGMGSVSAFIAPAEGRVRVTSVDNGWGYVMLKMGAVGLAAFSLTLVLLFREAFRRLAAAGRGRPRSDSLALLGLLAYGLVSFWGGPLFFHFTQVAFFGPALGGIVVLAEARRSLASAPAGDVLPAAAD
jgi:hypothetical protein